MAARLDSVAKYICDQSGWTLTNLALQKMLYLCQMIHMGRNNGDRLFEGHFEAWDYGPVEPSLYQRAKRFGAGPVGDIFQEALDFAADDYRRDLMNDVCGKFLNYSAGGLVMITHWDRGAWAKHYVPRARDIRIPDSDIWKEYQERQSALVAD